MNRVNPIKPAILDRRELLAGLWTGAVVASCFFVFRICVRLKIFGRLHADDALLLGALVLNLANASLWQAVSHQLYLSIAVSSGQIPLPPPDFLDEIYVYLRSQLASVFLYCTSLWLVKLSFLWFFRGLGNKIQTQRMIWWSVLCFTGASFFVCIGLFDYSCLAGPRGSKTLARCASNHAVSFEYVTTRVTTALDIVTDAFIILVSTNILWRAKINIRKKLALSGVFSLTVITIVVAIIRITLATDGPRLDLTWILFWGGVENSVAVIVACLGSFRTLYTHSDQSTISPRGFQNFKKLGQFQSDSQGIPLKNQGQNQIVVTASDDSYRSHRPESSESSEAYKVPNDGVHVRHDFSVIPGLSDHKY